MVTVKDDMKLQEEHEALSAAYAEQEELLKRVQADFQNYMKREDKQRALSAEDARITVLKGMLRLMDTIEAGIIAEKDKDSSAFKGLLMIHEEFKRFLKEQEVEEIVSLAKAFDSGHHDALMSREVPDEDKGMVVEVLQKGYRIGERIIRHAKVIVGK